MGRLALKAHSLLAADGHHIPLCDIIDAGTLFTRPIGAGCFERVGVEGGCAIGHGRNQFDVSIGELRK